MNNSKLKTILILLLVILCCLLASCADSKAITENIELTAEFRSFLALHNDESSDIMHDSADGYKFTLENGRLSITDSDSTEIWHSKDQWYVDSFRIGDINCDQILDYAFVVWKSYSFGTDRPARIENDDAAVRCHLFVYSIKDNKVKSLWCSSNLPRPIYSFELNEDGEQTPTLSGVRLVTLEGTYTDDYSKTEPTEFIYEWSSWGFSPVTSVPTPTTHYATLAVVGDLMCHTAQNIDAISKGGGMQYDFSYAFKHIAPYISAADYAIGNLETTITMNESKPSDFPVFSAPSSFAYAVKAAGFDLVTTANNHGLDFGKDGLVHTLQVLDDIGLEHTGTYASENDSEKITVIDVNSITFAILSFTYSVNGNLLPQDSAWCVNKEDKIKQDITQAKKLNPDIIIVMPHMGMEYETTTRQIFKDEVYEILKAGADLVLATHPHVLQPVEFVTISEENNTERNCFVAYSLGNFISSQRTAPRDYGVIANISFSKVNGKKATLDSVELKPVWVKFYSTDGSYDITVLPVSELDKPEFANIVNELSSDDIKRIDDVKLEFAKIYSDTTSIR